MDDILWRIIKNINKAEVISMYGSKEDVSGDCDLKDCGIL